MLIYVLNHPKKLKLILDTWLITGVLTAIYGIFQLYLKSKGIELDVIISDFLKTDPVDLGIKKIGKYGFRITSFFGDSNNYAAYLNTVIPISMFYFMDYLKQRNNLFIFLLTISTCILLTAEFLTFSRSGWMGTAVLLFVFIYSYRKTMLKVRFLKIVFMVIIFLGLLFYIYKDYLLLLLSLRLKINEPSINWHLIFMSYSLNLFLSNPIFGTGIGNYGVYYMKDFSMKANPHSTYLTWLSEIGLFGFIINIIIITVGIYFLIKMIKSDKRFFNQTGWILFAGYLGLLTSNIFYQTYAYHFYNIYHAIVLAFGNFILNGNKQVASDSLR